MTSLDATVGKSETVAAVLMGNIAEARAKPPVRENKKILDAARPPIDTLIKTAAPKVDTKKLDAARESIGIPKNDGSVDRIDISHSDRFNKIGQQHDLFKSYIEQGFESIANDKQEQMRKWVESTVLEDPRFADFATELKSKKSKKDADAFYEQVLKDPQFKTVVAERLQGLTQEFLDTRDPKALLEAADNVDDLRFKQDQQQTRRDRIARELDDSKKLLDEHYDGSGNPIKGSELQTLTDSKATDDSEYQLMEQQLQVLKSKVKIAQDKFKGNPKDKASEADYLNAIKEQQAKEQDLQNSNTQKRRDLEARLKKAKSDVQQLTDDLNEADQNLVKSQKALTAAEAKRNKLQQERDEQEVQYQDSLNTLIVDAGKDYWDDRVEETSKLYDTVLEEQKKQAEEALVKDKDNKNAAFDAAIATVQLTRWSEKRAGGLLGREKYRYRRENIESDYNRLLTQGPDEAVGFIVKASAIKAYNIDNTTPDNEILTKLAEQGVNINELKAQTIARIMQKKMAIGGIPKDEASHIIGTSWGQAAIAEGLKLHAEAKKTLAGLEKDEAIKRGIWRKMMQTMKAKPILLGALFVIGTGIWQAALAGAEGKDVQH